MIDRSAWRGFGAKSLHRCGAGNALSRLAAMALRRTFHSSSLFGAVGLGGVAALGTVALARCGLRDVRDRMTLRRKR